MARHGHSIDGQRFTFEAELGDALSIGAYVRIDTVDGRSYLGQVLHEIVVANAASERQPAVRHIEGGGVLLARLADERSVAVASSDVFGDGTVDEADDDVVRAYLDSMTAAGARLRLGTIAASGGLPADLVATGFNRHTFLCGQSGSGKTYTLGRVLEQLLLATDLRIAVFDPNSDYTHMASLRPRDETALGERAYGELEQRYGQIAAGIHVFGGPEAPRRLQARFGRLSRQQQTMLLGLDPIRDAEEYSAFVRTVDRIGGDAYGLEDVLLSLRDSFGDEERRLGMRIVNLGVADLPIWASAGDTPMREALPPDWRMLVFDLGSLASDRERWVASAAALGELWALRTRRQPLLIVIDEAHNVCPQEPVSPNQALATEHAVRIAGEGRKFGRYLLLATQRPEKVHANVVSQCDNLVLMRMNSAADIESLKTMFSFVPDTLVDQASGFGLGEGLAAGKIAPHPLRFVTGRRYTVEGGADIPSTWAEPR